MIAVEKAQRLVEVLTDSVVDELATRGLAIAGTPVLGPQYNAAACEALARELGNNPLRASEIMFALLAKKGEVGAVELAKALRVARTPTLAFVVTTPLKRISSRLGLPRPFDAATGNDGRTVWRDRDGIAARMLDAIRAEKKRRGI